jgi:seryl-tRNA synthetase
MLDIQFIRENPELVAEKAKQKGYHVDLKHLLEIDGRRRELLAEIEQIRADRNKLADSLKKGQPGPQDIAKGRALKEKLDELEKLIDPMQVEYGTLMKEVSNIFPDDTPLGGEDNNRAEDKWGETKSRPVKDHLTWGEDNGLIDFERGAKVAGNKFYFLKGPLVDLELAVFQFGLALAAKHGFTPMAVPHLVNARTLEGAGFAARGDEKQIYKVEDEDLNLIATAEIPLTGFHADEILSVADLPKLYAGLSPAYRVESGSYGKHSRGLYRSHQFNKLELYVFCRPDESEDWHQKLVRMEEDFCQALKIPYRKVRIAAGDLGAPAFKKYDIEYWTPADNSYHELMSCSNVTDYQARRLNIRFKNSKGDSKFTHTLNGTLAAASRLLIALIENHQDEQGKVRIPETLQPYMRGQTEI